MTAPWGPSVQLSRELFMTTDYLLLHFFSGDRGPFLAFLQPTPCLLPIFSPSFSSLSLHLSLSIHLSVTTLSLVSPKISPQATVNVWHEGTGSQSPQKPAVSIPDALSEIIRAFISIGAPFATCLGKVSHNWRLELERLTSPDTSLWKTRCLRCHVFPGPIKLTQESCFLSLSLLQLAFKSLILLPPPPPPPCLSVPFPAATQNQGLLICLSVFHSVILQTSM